MFDVVEDVCVGRPSLNLWFPLSAAATGEEATVKEDDNTDPPSSVPCELGACGVSVRDYHELFHRWKVCVHICLYVLMFDVGCMYLCLMLAVCTYV